MANTKWSEAGFVQQSSVALTDNAMGLVGGVNSKYTLTVLQAALTKLGLVTVTQPAASATLTIANTKTLTATDSTTLATNSITFGGGEVLTLTASNALTLTTTGSTNVTLPTSGTLMTNPMTTGGDVIYGGASGAPTRLANGTAGQVLTSGGTTVAPTWTTVTGTGTVTHTGALTANAIVLGNAVDDVKPMGSLGTATTVLHGNASGAPTFGAVNLATDVTGVIPIVVNAQTGTTYTVVAGDQGKLVTFSNGSAIAVTLPQATGSFTTGWSVTFLNLGAGLVTITPTTSTWNGGATVKLATGQGGTAVSDGTNYEGPVYQTGNALRSATTIVDVSAATAPSSGQVLTATSSTAATWQTPSGGSATPGLIIGCGLTWTSSTQLTIGSGQLYIESSNAVIAVAAQTITPSSPSNNTWYHGYVNSGGTFAVSTTAPVAFATACGYAMSKTGDTASRYVGSFRTGGSGTFFRFTYAQDGLFRWGGSAVGSLDGSPFRVLSAGSATSSTSVDASAAVPTTARMVQVLLQNTASSAIGYVSSGDVTVSTSLYDLNALAPGSAVGGPGNLALLGFCPCSSTQTFNYLNNAGSGALYIDVYGFFLQR